MRCLVCANPDLNLIDGSSIWAQTIALALAETGDVNVDFLAKSRPERDELFVPLQRHNKINVIDGTDKKIWEGKGFRRLSMMQMYEASRYFDEKNHYDLFVIRGFEIAKAFLASPKLLQKSWIYLTDIPQCIEEISPAMKEDLTAIANGSRKILCQSDGFMALWKKIVPDLTEDTLQIYAPVIPDLPAGYIPLEKRQPKAVYAGKFKGDWKTLEMAECWPKQREKMPTAELVMIGDKIHNEPDMPSYKQKMLHALQHTEGLIWLGALSRKKVQKEMETARIGLSWRDEKMNDVVEYSTKILEYGRAGCAAILNRNLLHEKLLGKDYPLYANSENEYEEKLNLALTNMGVLKDAAERLKTVAEKHTFSSRVLALKTWLNEEEKQMAGKKTLLVAGHDLKFFSLLKKKLEETGEYEILVDKWQGHNKHDEVQSMQLLAQADIIFCEWCLGNIKWYSHHKKPHQRLVARFHMQEKNLPYINESEKEAIDHIVFVSQQSRREALDIVVFPEEKTTVIANLLDDEKFINVKKMGDARYTIGIIGIVPKMKRFDRALDLLEQLIEQDSRYVLRVKGRNPLDYPWLLSRKHEIEYYEKQFERINSNEKLRYRVIFDPAGDDVNTWLQLVGFILSPSDFESFHLAIGEGMLTDAVPIIWNWKGAKEIWPLENVVANTDEAFELVHNENSAEEKNYRKWVQKHYNTKDIVLKWKKIIDGNSEV